MADRRRRSPEGFSRTKGKEPVRSVYDEPPRMPNYEQPRMRAGAEEVVYSSSSSSSSSSYINISRSYPRNKFSLRSFFTAPSERRHLRRRRSSRLFKIANSSSSSVNDDLAYGTGFIKRPKRRGVRSRKGKEIGGDRFSDRENSRIPRDRRDGGNGGNGGKPLLERAKTDAEILAIGAGLAKLARDQNKQDLRNARSGNVPDLGAGTSTGSFNNQGPSRGRGLVNSRPSHGSDTFDEDGWESASESEDSVDSRLAFGDESRGKWSFFGRKKQQPLSRKDTIVDPRLFGPHNSLHGIVTEPVGLGEVTPWTSINDFGQRPEFSEGGTGPSHSGSQASLQRVYPMPTSDPGRFDATASSVISGPEPMVVSRPGPIPIQQPQPIAPISQSVYGRSESGSASKQARESTSSGRGKSLAEAALVGVAGAAVGAAIASSRDDRKRREDEELSERNRRRRRDSEKVGKDSRGREKRSSPDREELREKRRTKDDSSRVSVDKSRREKKHERRKDETRDEGDERPGRRGDEPRDDSDERREKRRKKLRSATIGDQGEVRRTKSETAVPQTVVDPFQYQVPDDAFPTPTIEASQRRMESVPEVHYVTVEREPDFSRIPPIRDARTPDFMKMHRQEEPKYVESEQLDRDRALHEAQEIYEETTHSTAPIAAAAFGAAVAAVHHADGERESRSDKRRDERRGEKRSDYDYYNSEFRDREPEKKKDPIQEEADRAYREIVMARKIASQVIRSRTPSPDRSVTEKYTSKEEEEEEIIRIVTPPGMENHKETGLYDAPNADFTLDHVLDPMELQTFRISPTNMVRVDAEGPYLKRDPDADRPRPFLNLVRPTPAPSPILEKQAARSERDTSSKSKDREESKQSSRSDAHSRDEDITSSTASTVSKGVTWGENETKHYEVENPSGHRDEYVSKSDIDPRESREDPKPAAKPKTKSKGWGAIAAGIMGAGVGAAAAASSSETSKTSKSKEDEKKDGPYEYRGVVVEPESQSQSSNQRDAPPTGPKPSSISQTSRVPGAFSDDLDFTATVAAGLQDTGFDPNIVIDDPSFRRRESPPGSNDHRPYRAPFAETVSDLGTIPSEVSGARTAQGFVIGEVASTPQDWRSVSPPREDETPTKLNKEQKKRDKERRRSGDVTPLEESSRDVVEEPKSYFEPPLSKKEQKKRDKLARQNSQGDDITPSVAEAVVEEPERYFETPKKSKKKSKKGSSSIDDYADDASRDTRTVSVPIDAYDDLRNDDDDWADAKKSKKKSKRDSDRYDSPAQSVPSSEIASELERSSSKKSKDESKRKSEQYEFEPTEISLPPSTPSETSRDGEFDESRGSRKSSARDSGIFNSADRGDSRSVVSADASRYDDDEPRKSKKKSRSSTKDDYDRRSVVSAPAGDDYEDSKRSKKKDKDKEKDKKSGGSFFGLFGSKSEVSARDESSRETKGDFEEPKKKKKSKRSSVPDSSSIYGDIGAQSVSDISRSMSNGNGDKNGSYPDDPEEQYDDDPGERRKTRSRSESSSSKKDSFLGNAGTLGAGVGIAGAAVAIAAQQYQQSKAANANSSKTAEAEQFRSSPGSMLPSEILDPEITERQFRPSIDPQYGDLLPLPPSNPDSPNSEPLDDLPELPDSRPDTPEPERISREKSMSSVRKNLQETPMKSPSQSAVPLNFLMRNRSQPSSPGVVRSSPIQSPATPNQDSLSFLRYRPRPTSWDSSKEYKPLYLVESNRRGSAAQLMEPEEELPALPPSQTTSRSSSQLDLEELSKDPLSIDTELASSKPAEELLGSEQSTPKAAVMTRDGREIDDSFDATKSIEEPSLPTYSEQRSPEPEPKSRFGEHVAEAAAAAGLVSTIGYFASSPTHPKTEEFFLDELPSAPRQPSPVDPMTKDRSSYLLQSSPMSRNLEDIEPEDRALDSPSRKQKSSLSSNDAMESIREREIGDIFESPKALPEHIEQERERTMNTLSSSPRDELAKHETTRDLLGPEIQQLQEEENMTQSIENQAKPADEFTFTKSKKDKKKDEKKRNGLSRSSTQDDFSIPESPRDVPEETSPPAENESAADEFIHTKSKKDKKKDKKGRSALAWEPEESEIVAQQTEESILETTQDVSKEIAAPVDNEPDDDFLSIKSKKHKKRDKKGRSASAWEPEESESAAQQMDEPILKTTQDVSEEIAAPVDNEPDDDFFSTKSKKHKKRDKKGRLALAWEPEESESAAQQTDEPILETTQDVSEEIAAPVDNEPDDDFLSIKSKKHKKRDRKGRSASAWEPEESESVSRMIEEPAPETSRAVSEDIPIPFDNEPVDDFFTTKSRKDKKKDKKGKSKAVWEPEDDETLRQSQELEPQPMVATNRDIPEDAQKSVNVEPTDEFSISKLKKDKKKDKKRAKSASAWDPEDENKSQMPPEPTGRENRGLVEETTPGDVEGLQDLSFTKSKKDRKKDKMSKSTSAVGSEKDQPESSMPETSQDLLEEPLSISQEISVPETVVTVPAEDLATREMPGDRDIVAEPKPHDIPSDTARDTHTEAHESPKHDDFVPSEEKLATTDNVIEEAPRDMTSKDSPPETIEDVAREHPVVEDFTTFETKKAKKKWGKSPMAWEQEDEAAVLSESTRFGGQPEYSQDVAGAAAPVEEFFTTESKKSKKDKKKRGKSVITWEPEEEPAPSSKVQEIDDTQQFEAATSKKGKKKNRKLSSIVPEDDLTSEPQESVQYRASQEDAREPVDDLKAEGSPLPTEASTATEQVKSTGPEDILNAPETLSSKPTPIGGPGAWPTTPATTWTSGEVPESSSKEYFPAVATHHSPLTQEMQEESQSKGYFSSAEAILPVAIAGATMLSAELASKEPPLSKDHSSKDASNSRSLDYDEPSSWQADSKPAPDGFTAGYDNEQLSLAKRLQEEFSSGNRKSKKDRKRQSLPPTPVREPSRSRTVEELSELLPRARSLSIGPAAGRTGLRPLSGERQNTYSEDQLEFARQLKSEFESGNKKSKKDKKKRQGVSRSSTQDDMGFDRDLEESQMTVPDVINDAQEPEISESTPKGDGFAAGYQENQLSLARQLQAEFGENSKKDKKRRSTSQTLQQQAPRDDYFGEPANAPVSDVTEQEREVLISEPSGEKETTPDGLAVGYSEEQLEIARQLKGEFGSGSKKSKKDKKDKKRGSLLRSKTEDDFSSDAQPRESGYLEIKQLEAPEAGLSNEPEDEFAFSTKKSKKDKKGKKRGSLLAETQGDDFSSEALRTADTEATLQGVDTPESKGFDEGPVESAIAETEDAFAFVSKKSKKDKKSKKRGSLLPTNPEDDLPSESPLDDRGESRGVDVSTQPDLAQEFSSEPLAAEPGDEFAAFTKKSKKDKKGKKRDSHLRSATEEDISSDNFGNEVEALHAACDLHSRDIELEPTKALPEDDRSVSAKIAKKDQKRQHEIARDGSFDEPDIEASSMQPKEKLSTANITAASSASEALGEPIDDFGFLTRKSKKEKKKRGSLLRTSTFDETLEQQFEDAEIQPALEREDPGDSTGTPVTLLADEQDDEFEYSSKKPKKDKKKRGSLLRTSTFDETPEQQFEDAEIQPALEREDPGDSAGYPGTPLADEQDNEFEYSSKKSKKNKKKRKSLQQTSVAEDTVTEAAEPPRQDHKALGFAEDVKPSNLETEDRAPESPTRRTTFDEDNSLSQPLNFKMEYNSPESNTREAGFDEDDSSNKPREEAPSSGPPDIFHDFAFSTEESKEDKEERKLSTKVDSKEAPESTASLDPISEPKSIIESSQPLEQEEHIKIEQPVERDLDSFTTSALEDKMDEPADEWNSFPSKKSKKDKKRRGSSRTASQGPSGISTPLEPILEPEVADTERSLPAESMFQENKSIEERLSQEPEHAIILTAEDNAEQPADEWASVTTKKSKKDKKKSKNSSRTQSEGPSGISMPFNPILEPETNTVEPPITTEIVPEMAIASSEPLNREPEDPTGTMAKDKVEELPDEWPSFTTKKSQKDKKKRKSGLSTPAEPVEDVRTFEPKKPFIEESDQSALHAPQFESDAQAMHTEEPMYQFIDETPRGTDPQVQEPRDLEPWNEHSKEPEATEESFAFVTKRSKKDKKSSKRSSRALSESRAISSDALSIDPGAEPERAMPPENIVSSPVTLQEETFKRDANEPSGDEERMYTFASGLSRAPSKKDKRKRQATVNVNMNDGVDAPKPPLTSWADEVEEAEVERKIPVIQDIAKDESLSHIARTTESSPVDDFFRPTKKGKKGKKRISEPTSSAESSRPPIESEMPRDEPADEHSNVLKLAAAGAALAGAPLLSKGCETLENTSKSETSAGATVPQRKVSKREKKSIDRDPIAREDIFDDPALWEGAEPKPHEEIRHAYDGDDDAGSDGFGFTSRDVDEPTSTHETYEARDPIPGYEDHSYPHDGSSAHGGEARLVSPTTGLNFIPEENFSHRESGADVVPIGHHAGTETTQEAHEPPREEQQVHYVSEEFAGSTSTADERTTEIPSERYISEETVQQKDDVQSITQPHFSGPPRSIVDTPPSDKEVSFEEPPPIIQEHISTSPRDSVEHSHSERSVAFEDLTDRSPARPLSTSKYGRTSFSDLPVVHEENPAQIESEFLPPQPHYDGEANRDSAFITGSPVPRQRGFTDHHDEHVRDSGVHLRDFSPAEKTRAHVSSTDDALARLSWPHVDEETETVDLHKSQRPIVETSPRHHHQEGVHSVSSESYSLESHSPKGDKATDFYRSQRSTEERPKHHSEVVGSRDLFPSYKSTEERSKQHHDEGAGRDHLPSQHIQDEKHTDLHRVPTIHGHGKPREDSLVKQRVQRIESPDFQRPLRPKEDKYPELSSSQRPKAERPKGMSETEAGVAIAGASLGFAAARKLSQEHRPLSAQSQRSSSNINRMRTPDPKRPDSVASNRSGTPPLRRTDRKLSGDLRSLSQRSKPDLAKEAELAALASSASQVSTANPTANEGRVRAKDMADVYDGFGEGRMGSPRSPTRPHSMRRRQSMQVLDLESRVEQLAAENRMLTEARAQAERALESSSHASASLVEKDAEIDSLKRTLDWLQNEVTRLTQVNEGLNSAHVELGRQHNERYGALESQHTQATRELQEVRDAHDNLSAGMEGIVRNEVQRVVQDKDREIAQLRAELDAAKEQIREMQRQILASKADEIDFLTVRDEDYFDNACQMLCQHVQQWVLRFSKFSDMRACRLSNEINNDKTIDRLDNAILDGSDVDIYLSDRIKRRDVFMSMTMNMVWEFIFTRYLFGMDREQRQKLKSLEKTLSEVGPAAAVHHWRATTLTLLSKREAFVQQREQDTQAVVHAIIETLSEILPPPSNLEAQIEEQLTRVMKEAVDLSIEMRTQRAEYMMLPPLLPEYDANGDLASKVSFNAALMNERSGDTVSNEELEEQQAVVRIVLFPLVVKKGDDKGEGDEEIVVCPAQVLVAKPKKSVRVFSAGSVQGHSRISLQSSMPADYGEGSVI